MLTSKLTAGARELKAIVRKMGGPTAARKSKLSKQALSDAVLGKRKPAPASRRKLFRAFGIAEDAWWTVSALGGDQNALGRAEPPKTANGSNGAAIASPDKGMEDDEAESRPDAPTLDRLRRPRHARSSRRCARRGRIVTRHRGTSPRSPRRSPASKAVAELSGEAEISMARDCPVSRVACAPRPRAAAPRRKPRLRPATFRSARGRGRGRMKTRTPATDLARRARRSADRAASKANRFAEYRDDPCGFARACWPNEPLWSAQEKILEAIAASDRVTVRSGQRVGKTRVLGVALLWFIATRPPTSRAIITAPSAFQVGHPWREVRLLHARSAIALGGTCALRHSTGLAYPDGREVIGISPESPVRLQGIASGGEGDLFFVGDEASGIDDDLIETVIANLATGRNQKLLLVGNPNFLLGAFHESHRAESTWTKIHIDSRTVPGFEDGNGPHGLARKEWADEIAREYGGVDGATYAIRVKGDFAEGAAGRVFPPALIKEAKERWATTSASGPLTIGVDPAGEQPGGDESAFCARRGPKVLQVHGRFAVTPDAHVAIAVGMISELRGDSTDTPRINVDADGDVGQRVVMAFRAYVEEHPNVFILTPIHSGARASRSPDHVDRMRDEMYLGLRDQLREKKLALPDDARLERDLGAIHEFSALHSGRSKISTKDFIRDMIGRSCDRGDALALACIEVVDWFADRRLSAPKPLDAYAGVRAANRSMDPYSAMDPWGGQRRRR